MQGGYTSTVMTSIVCRISDHYASTHVNTHNTILLQQLYKHNIIIMNMYMKVHAACPSDT